MSENQTRLLENGSRVSIESGHSVEWSDEKNYMFKLSNFQEMIIKWAEKNERIKPKVFQKILLDMLKEELPDISISRPFERVPWGITVPNDDTQTVYVWLDALVNYLTSAGYPDKLSVWPPTIQVLGKDILKFHGIFWPAFLFANDLSPPEQLFVHSHWTVEGQKMSKSKNNVIDPYKVSELYTMEGLRFFLVREGVPQNDSNYSQTKTLRILNAELADTLGNLLSRTCAATINPNKIFPKIDASLLNVLSKKDSYVSLSNLEKQLSSQCLSHYESYNYYKVVDEVFNVLRAANKFFEDLKPWELRKETTKNVALLETIIGVTMNTLRKCGIILQPIVPEMSKNLLDRLNISSNERFWDSIDDDIIEIRKLGSRDTLLFKRILK